MGTLAADMDTVERTHPAAIGRSVGRVVPRARALGLTLLAVAPALLCLAFQRTYAVNVPVYDEWRIVSMFSKLYAGTLTVGDVARQHNEHIAALPYAITLLVGYYTAYDTTIPMYLSWVALCLISATFYAWTRKIVPDRRWTLLAFIPVPWVLFGFRQWENLLLGIGIAIMLANLLALLTFWLCDTCESFDVRFVAAIWCATLASFSFAHALVIWPVAALQLFVIRGFWGGLRKHRQFPAMAVAWALAWIAMYTFYFMTFERALSDMHQANRVTLLTNPLQALIYYVSALGAPLTNEPVDGRVYGAALLALTVVAFGYLVLRHRSQLVEVTLPIAVTLFALVSAAAFTSGRVSLGVNQAFASRYISVTSLAIVGLYLLLLYGWRKRVGGAGYVVPFFVGLIAIGVVTAYPRGNTEGQTMLGIRTTQAYYLATFDMQSDQNLQGILPSAGMIRTFAPSLRENGLTVFRDDPTSPPNVPYDERATIGIVDTVNGQMVARQQNRAVLDASRDSTVTIAGWAADGAMRRAGRAVFLSIDDQKMMPTIYGRERPDVAQNLEMPSETGLGFLASFSINALGPGTHRITPVLVGAGGSRLYVVDHSITIDVR